MPTFAPALIFLLFLITVQQLSLLECCLQLLFPISSPFLWNGHKRYKIRELGTHFLKIPYQPSRPTQSAHSKYLIEKQSCCYPLGTPGLLSFSGLTGGPSGLVLGVPHQALVLHGFQVLALVAAFPLPFVDSKKLLVSGDEWDLAWLEFARRFPTGAKKVKITAKGSVSSSPGFYSIH